MATPTPTTKGLGLGLGLTQTAAGEARAGQPQPSSVSNTTPAQHRQSSLSSRDPSGIAPLNVPLPRPMGADGRPRTLAARTAPSGSRRTHTHSHLPIPSNHLHLHNNPDSPYNNYWPPPPQPSSQTYFPPPPSSSYLLPPPPFYPPPPPFYTPRTPGRDVPIDPYNYPHYPFFPPELSYYYPPEYYRMMMGSSSRASQRDRSEALRRARRVLESRGEEDSEGGDADGELETERERRERGKGKEKRDGREGRDADEGKDRDRRDRKDRTLHERDRDQPTEQRDRERTSRDPRASERTKNTPAHLSRDSSSNVQQSSVSKRTSKVKQEQSPLPLPPPPKSSTFDETPIKPLSNNKEALKIWNEFKEQDGKPSTIGTTEQTVRILELVPVAPSPQTKKSKPELSSTQEKQQITSLTTLSSPPPAQQQQQQQPSESPETTEPLVPCPTCSRSFSPSRLATHQAICQSHSPRKKFDMKQKRLGELAKDAPREEEKAKRAKEAEEMLRRRKGGWRRKHEQLITSLRAARSPSASPPSKPQRPTNERPPISDPLPQSIIPQEQDDRVACRHCGRKFAEERVARHVEICGGIREKKKGWKSGGGGGWKGGRK